MIRPWSLGCAEVKAAAEELLHSPLMMTQRTFIHEPVSFLTRLIPVAFSQIIVAAQDFLGSYANNQASASAADVGRHRMAAPLVEESGSRRLLQHYDKGSPQSRL